MRRSPPSESPGSARGSLHPRILGRVCVGGRAAVFGGAGSQFEVPGLVVVDLAQPKSPTVLGQPHDGVQRCDVDAVSRDVDRRRWIRDPTGAASWAEPYLSMASRQSRSWCSRERHPLLTRRPTSSSAAALVARLRAARSWGSRFVTPGTSSKAVALPPTSTWSPASAPGFSEGAAMAQATPKVITRTARAIGGRRVMFQAKAMRRCLRVSGFRYTGDTAGAANVKACVCWSSRTNP